MTTRSNDEDKERQDIEQLCYFGLRAAFGTRLSRDELRTIAQDCIERKFKQFELWTTETANEAVLIPFENEENLIKALAQNRGAIVCTAHIGSYHFIPLELVKRKYAVTMLLDEVNFEREKNKFAAWEKRFAGQEPLRYINAELPNAAWEMARDLREGRILFIWLDGNTGINKHDAAKTLVEITFCGLQILVRKGLAYLSAWNDSPIIYAAALPDSLLSSAIRFEPALQIKKDTSREVFCQQAMQAVWNQLESFIEHDPACWEEWYHLRLWQVRNEITRDLSTNYEPEEVLELVLAANAADIDFLKLSEGDVIANSQNGVALLFDENVRAVLEVCDGQQTVSQMLDRLSSRFDDATILETLHALTSAGFVRRSQNTDH